MNRALLFDFFLLFSRLPDQSMMAYDRLQGPAATYGYPELPLSGNVTRLSTIVEILKILIQNFY